MGACAAAEGTLLGAGVSRSGGGDGGILVGIVVGCGRVAGATGRRGSVGSLRERHCRQRVLRVEEAPTRGRRDLQDGVLWDRHLPSVLDRDALEVGNEQLQHRDVRNKEHRPCRHLHLDKHTLQPLDHIHVALSAGEAPPQRVLPPLGIEHWVPLLHLLPRRGVAVALDVPPTGADGALVDGVQGRRLLMIARHVVHRGSGSRHRAGEHLGRLRRLADRGPILRGALPQKLRQGERGSPPQVAELRKAVAFVGALRVPLTCPCPD
mmetsp:Transcript_2016/g.5823  ORF Transcript_2016/g.5823 Transcript_2016/m.5823 type:complete len:265 (+) Transcript_2016:354-1148(+)